MKKQRGFSLIELLIVVAIILIIAAIAIPNLLRAKISANESSAVGSVRNIITAEVSYQASYPQVGFANKLADLGPGGGVSCPGTGPTTLAACLIDSVLAAGTKSGYTFAAAATPFVAPSTTFTSFTAGAAPLSYNKTGVRRFCAGDDGVLRQDPNTAGSIVVPAQPWDVNCTAAPWLVLQ